MDLIILIHHKKLLTHYCSSCCIQLIHSLSGGTRNRTYSFRYGNNQWRKWSWLFSETDILPVIPVYGDSLLQSFGSRLSMNRFKAKSKEDDFSNTLFDLRDLPINILVRDNPQGLYLTAKRKRYKKWFSSHYSSAPAIFTTKK